MSGNFFIRLKVRVLTFLKKPFFLKKWNKIGKNNPGIYEKLRNLPGKNNEEQLRAYNEMCRNMK